MAPPASIIELIRRRLAAAVPPGSQVVLFGSCARGDNLQTSDIDLLVIEPQVAEPLQECVRLRETIGELELPVDVVVFPADVAHRRAMVRGTVVERALREGTLLVES